MLKLLRIFKIDNDCKVVIDFAYQEKLEKWTLWSRILNIGINLNHIGINAYAYDYQVIPDLLDNLKANNRIILGGDVFCYKNGQLKHTYDHWYYEKQDPTIDSSKSIFQTF